MIGELCWVRGRVCKGLLDDHKEDNKKAPVLPCHLATGTGGSRSASSTGSPTELLQAMALQRLSTQHLSDRPLNPYEALALYRHNGSLGGGW